MGMGMGMGAGTGMVVTADEMRRLAASHARTWDRTYRIVLQFLSDTIRAKAMAGENGCSVTVPPMIFGAPAYDVSACARFVRTQLERRGFRVSPLDDDTMFVEWNHRPAQ